MNLIAAISLITTLSGPLIKPPAPFGAIPSMRQQQWHLREFYGFLHFTVNTFTDKEWGFGDENADIFNPQAFNADKIVKAMKASGMTQIILTAKHHDGFH